MKKFLYVDTENVGSEYINYLDNLDESWEIHHIYTGMTCNLDFSLVCKIYQSKAKSKFIRAVNGTLNSLDFCLVADLSFTASNSTDSLHIILSKDKGYKPAIEYLKSLGYVITQIDTLEKILEFILPYEYDLDEHAYNSIEKSKFTGSRDKLIRDVTKFFLGIDTCITLDKTLDTYTLNSIDNNINLDKGYIHINNILENISFRGVKKLRDKNTFNKLKNVIISSKGDLKEIK